MVFGLCRLLLRDPVEAEDATQQVFLAAHRRLRDGFTPREPGPWLAAIARNECRARARARRRAPAELPLLVESLPDPVAVAVRTADLDALWRALAELPRRQRKAFLLRELGGLSYRELGVALGVTQPAVESLLFRARRRLRAAMTAAGAAAMPGPLRDQLARLLPAVGPSSPATAGARCAAVAVGLGLGAAGVAELPRHEARPHRAQASAVVRVRPVRPPRHEVAAATPPAPSKPAPIALVTPRQRDHAARDVFARRAVRPGSPRHRERPLHPRRDQQPESEPGAPAPPAPAVDDAPAPVAVQIEQPPDPRHDDGAVAVTTVAQDGSGDDMTNHGDGGGSPDGEGSSGGGADHSAGGD